MSDTEEIKQRLPIEDLVGSYLPLKKAGRIFKGLCPFHSEKTPSFTVSPERGIYKCFGCGEGGDIFDFVIKMEGLTFPEALKLLAERAGVTLKDKPDFSPQADQPAGISRERLRQINRYVTKLWYLILTEHPKAQPARDYLHKRGLSEASIKTFQLGYAPLGSATALALKKAGFTPSELAGAGDPSRFQDRIIFPIADITGNVVGFTGRLLETEEDPERRTTRGPKYWNTPETSLFIKSRTLFALHVAKQAIQHEDVAILAEGQMDVLMLHQSGYAQSVASSGTALTSEQVQLISRFTTNLAFAYDQDAAGLQATERGLELVLSAGLNPSVITTPQGKDPADCLLQAPEQWESAYINRQPFMHWLIDRAMQGQKELTPVRKKEIAARLLPWVAKVTDPLEQQEWLRWLAGRLQTEERNLHLAMARLTKQPNSAKISTSSAMPPAAVTPLLPEVALALLLAFPSLFAKVKGQLEILDAAEPNSAFLHLILPILRPLPPEAELKTQLTQQLTETQQKELSLYVQEVLQSYQYEAIDQGEGYAELLLILQRLRSEAKEHTKTHLAQQIRLAQENHDSQKLHDLFSELKNLI